MTFIQYLIDAVALGAVYSVVALAIGLVFGVMRLINLAYGEIITAGAYTLAYLSGQSALVAILACIGVTCAFSLVQELVFRPLRGTSPATMLVATFGVSFLLQNVYFLAFGARGKAVGTLGGLNTAIAVGSLTVSLAVFVSPPPLTVAWFVTLAGALLATATVTVIAG